MLENSSNSTNTSAAGDKKKPARRWWVALALPAWVFVCFGFAQVFVVAIITLLRLLGVDFAALNSSILETILAALIYVLSFTIIVMLPWIVRRNRTTKDELGVSRLPSWMDIGLAPAAFVIYLIASGTIIYVISQLVPGFDASERQDIGFQDLTQQYEYLLAFITLVVIAPIAEEAIFRGYLYGKLRKRTSMWVTILITSLLFAVLHMKLDDGLVAGVNVGIDVFILSLAMCGLREVTGNIWAGVMVHMMKNGLAYYLLFINTSLLTTMGG